MLKLYLAAKRTLSWLMQTVFGVRVMTFLVQRIGHLASEPDLYVKER